MLKPQPLLYPAVLHCQISFLMCNMYCTVRVFVEKLILQWQIEEEYVNMKPMQALLTFFMTHVEHTNLLFLWTSIYELWKRWASFASDCLLLFELYYFPFVDDQICPMFTAPMFTWPWWWIAKQWSPRGARNDYHHYFISLVVLQCLHLLQIYEQTDSWGTWFNSLGYVHK